MSEVILTAPMTMFLISFEYNYVNKTSIRQDSIKNRITDRTCHQVEGQEVGQGVGKSLKSASTAFFIFLPVSKHT